MSVTGKVTIHVSQTLEPTGAQWFSQTVHNKKSGETQVYLFQRNASQIGFGKKITDFMNGIRPAENKANKHLHRALSENVFENAKLGHIKTALIQSSHHESELELGINTNSGTKRSTPAFNGSAPITFKIKVKDNSAERSNLKNLLENFFSSESVNPRQSETQRKLMNAIDYAIDLRDGVARPKSKAEIKAMADRIDQFLVKASVDEEGKPDLGQITDLCTKLNEAILRKH
ncbi:MAG: hypothetical protein RL001_2076 [Pseudomonadota bacterium]|jgi:hypothetical protein